MKFSVRVTANARKPKILVENDNFLKVWVDAPAIEGKANRRLIEILAAYYNKPKSSFSIETGLRSRNKVVEMHGDKQ